VIIDFCQRFTERRESRRPAGELIRTSEYDVELMVPRVAKRFVRTHHYLGTTSPTAHAMGLYRRGELAGVALFGPPASMNAHRAVFPTLAPDEGVTLGRLVLTESVPGNGESWFIARCFQLLRVRGVVAVESCADPEPRDTSLGKRVFVGHLGIIYQATNGRYVGKTNPSTRHLLPDGTCFSNRAGGKIRNGERGKRYAARQLVKWGADPIEPGEDERDWLKFWVPRLTRSVRHRGNHRYLWCLDQRRRREVLHATALPYPKFARAA
jgi:hypothetical protein